MYEVPLTYDPVFARKLTWRLNEQGDGVRARVSIGSGAEAIIDFRVRWHVPRSRAGVEAVFVRPLDGETWLTESAVFSPDLPRCQLVLGQVPRHVDDYLRQL